jgi:glycosyltransferase involved in cell wall biosynthesis
MNHIALHIAFITDGEPFHGASPEERALGGSETALVQVARALARRGHRVQVFCRCPAPGLYHGVTYRDRKDLVRACQEERWDVAVVSRHFVALDLPLQAGLKVLWNHDLLVKPGPLAQRLEQVDLALVLSRFHAEDYLGHLPSLGPKLELTRNGLDLALMDRASLGVAKTPGKLTYVSRPERGLKILLERIWPALHQARPGLSLDICGYEVEESLTQPSWRREREAIERLLESSPGVRVLGGLAKADYYRHLASAELLLYPCCFPEISCLAVLEAQALGTALVTTDGFALSESVQTPEFRVGGVPESPEYAELFIERVLELLAEPGRIRELAMRARELVRQAHDWSLIAGQWEEMFLTRLGQRLEEQAPALAASLLLNGDLAVAEGLLQRSLACPDEGPAPEDPDEAGLMAALGRMAWQALGGQGRSARVGVLSADGGRTSRALSALLAPTPVEAIDLETVQAGAYALVLVRDHLERDQDPAALLARLEELCQDDGHLLLCVASGAWPLIGPGHLGRRHDLGREELAALLPGRRLNINFLGRGLVRMGPARYLAGRWLVLAPASGPRLGSLDESASLRRVRPAPPRLLEEVRRAGLI